MMLEVKDIRVLYGKAIALNGLTMNLNSGELVGVVGPNGAGKTTLLRAISAVVPVQGEITFNGATDSQAESPMRSSRWESFTARKGDSSLRNSRCMRIWRWALS